MTVNGLLNAMQRAAHLGPRSQSNGLSTNDKNLIEKIIRTMFTPRYVRTSDTALTLTTDHWGGRYLFTSSSAITVTIPTGLPEGFIWSGIAVGTGTVTLSGKDQGSSTSAAQWVPFTIEVLDDGTRLASGGGA